MSLKCFPNLVDGAGDETLYIFSTSKYLRERVTEGGCCLDGWEADLSWNESNNKCDKKAWDHAWSQKKKKTLQAFALHESVSKN